VFHVIFSRPCCESGGQIAAQIPTHTNVYNWSFFHVSLLIGIAFLRYFFTSSRRSPHPLLLSNVVRYSPTPSIPVLTDLAPCRIQSLKTEEPEQSIASKDFSPIICRVGLKTRPLTTASRQQTFGLRSVLTDEFCFFSIVFFYQCRWQVSK